MGEGGPKAVWWQVAGESTKGGGLRVFRLGHPNDIV